MPLAARSVFMFAGQACIASSRFYVERPLYEEFVKRFSKIIGKLGMGDLRDPNTVIAPVISLRQRERIKSHIDDARAKGANVIGGEWEGNRCQPTLLTEVSEDMSVCRTETFGPVTAIYSIENYDEGLEKANDTEYGLSSAIFTKDIDRAFHFVHAIRTRACATSTAQPSMTKPMCPSAEMAKAG